MAEQKRHMDVPKERFLESTTRTAKTPKSKQPNRLPHQSGVQYT